MTSPLSVVFAGTPEFSVPALEALVASEHRVVAVYTQPDRPSGRGQKISLSAVKQCALAHGLPVEQPPTLRDPVQIQRLESLRPDVMVVVAYGLILPPAVLAIPRLGCINIHASLLPRWRGAAPIHRAILAGDTETGVTIMRMEAGLDTGPILLEHRESIRPDDTTASLHARLATAGSRALIEALPGVADGSRKPRIQPTDGVTYAAKIAKDEARIDWSKSADELDRQVRAFNPWPVAETRWRGEQLRVWASAVADRSTTARPGTVISATGNGIDVATGAGVLRLERVQMAGRKPTNANEFVRAHRLDDAILGGE